MKITNIEVLEGKRDISFPAPYYPAWTAPGGRPSSSFRVTLLRISTDEGICGYGPFWGRVDDFIRNYLIGSDPLLIERFWFDCMNGREGGLGRSSCGAIDIALWDIAGKAAGLPISKLLGAKDDRVPVYAATSRLLDGDELAELALEIQAQGFRAIKLRMHRQCFKDDLAAVGAVREACPDMFIIVDANQNNRSVGYNYWDLPTAELVARELQAMGVAILEEPRGRYDMEGLSKLSENNAIRISGGEHSANIHEFREHLLRGTYGVIQPDPIIGDIGVTGMRKLGVISEYLGRQFMPHVCGLGAFALSFAAAVQVVSTLSNCPYLEFNHDPPFLTPDNQQFYINEKFTVGSDGCVGVPQAPGLGVEVLEDAI